MLVWRNELCTLCIRAKEGPQYMNPTTNRLCTLVQCGGSKARVHRYVDSAPKHATFMHSFEYMYSTSWSCARDKRRKITKPLFLPNTDGSNPDDRAKEFRRGMNYIFFGLLSQVRVSTGNLYGGVIRHVSKRRLSDCWNSYSSLYCVLRCCSLSGVVLNFALEP